MLVFVQTPTTAFGDENATVTEVKLPPTPELPESGIPIPEFPALATLLMLVAAMATSLVILRRSKKLNIQTIDAVRRALPRSASGSTGTSNIGQYFFKIARALFNGVSDLFVFPNATKQALTKLSFGLRLPVGLLPGKASPDIRGIIAFRDFRPMFLRLAGLTDGGGGYFRL